MSREETLDPAHYPYPSKRGPGTAGGGPVDEATTPGVLVIAPPNRLLYLNQSARRLLAETRRPGEPGAGAAALSQREAISRFVRQLSARMFRSVPLLCDAGTPLEIKGLNHPFGAHLRVHGLLFQDGGDRRQCRALVVVDRVFPP